MTDSHYIKVVRRFRSWRTVAAVGLVVVALVAVSLLEGDVADDLTGFGSLVSGLLNRFGAAASFALLRAGELDVVSDDYEKVTGRKAATIAQIIMELADEMPLATSAADF